MRISPIVAAIVAASALSAASAMAGEGQHVTEADTPANVASPAVVPNGTILLVATRANNYESSNTAFAPVPLDDAGDLSLTFTTTVPNQTVIMTYNAECGVLGPTSSWQAVEIVVGGNVANPKSGGSFAMCSATSTSDFIWTGAVRQSVLLFPHPGSHTIQVLNAAEDSSTEIWLGDTSLVVWSGG